MARDDMIDWTLEVPTHTGRYFVRPAHSTHQGKVVVVIEFGEALAAVPSPELSDFFRLADLDKLPSLLGVSELEWSFIDDVVEPEWNYVAEVRDESHVFPEKHQRSITTEGGSHGNE